MGKQILAPLHLVNQTSINKAAAELAWHVNGLGIDIKVIANHDSRVPTGEPRCIYADVHKTLQTGELSRSQFESELGPYVER